MVIAQGQGVEAGPGGGPRLAEHRQRALPVAARSLGGERGANGYADTHHTKVYPTEAGAA